MNSLNESLLASWVNLSTSVNNERVVSEMPYNESLVCHILYRNTMQAKDTKMTATELCEQTHILKSQMNRILNHLEEKKFIKRSRSEQDKRQVYISFNPEQADSFQKQHEKLLRLLDAIIGEIGVDAAKEAAELFNKIATAANKFIH